jgi:hypothetical protein
MEKKRLAIMILAALLFIVFFMPGKSGFGANSPAPAAVTGVQSVVSPSSVMTPENYGSFSSSQGSPAGTMENPMGSWEMDGISSAALIPREVVSTDDFGQYDPSAILSGQNYLDPRSQIGYPETLGGVLRNANRQYRSEPLNPRDPVSIFNLSTIPPDVMRPQFDIVNDYQ